MGKRVPVGKAVLIMPQLMSTERNSAEETRSGNPVSQAHKNWKEWVARALFRTSSASIVERADVDETPKPRLQNLLAELAGPRFNKIVTI